MTKLNYKFALLYAENLRSLSYLKFLKKNNFIPTKIIVISNNEVTKNINRRHRKKINNLKKILDYFRKKALVINLKNKKEKILENLKDIEEEYIIFAGNYGQILQKQYFNFNKFFIHVHPGNLPDYKGSTTYYYEYLLKNKITFTSIFLDKKLDSGRIIYKKSYSPKKINLEKMDTYYDLIYRSEVLINTLKLLNKKKIYSDPIKTKNQSFYVIHPILKHIAILKAKL
tara:strand:- start:350 stop:1033 length:684 start_codon:yes stop_codon:yes gene_type:complete